MKRNKFILCCLFLLFSLVSTFEAQEMTLDQYTSLVLENHPELFQIEIKVEQSELQVKQSRGQFDPTITADGAQKKFDEKDYYSKINAGLKIPTWYGTDFNVGYTNNKGEYLNPESYTPNDGLLNVGVEVDVLQGIVMDKRKTSLKKAQWYQKATVEEQKIRRNEVIFEALYAYRVWQQTYEIYLATENFINSSRDRVDGVVQLFELGEKSAVDTLEAHLSWMDRLNRFYEAELEFKNASLNLNLFLWLEGTVPLELDGALPERLLVIEKPSFSMIEDSLLKAHPKIKKIDYGTEALLVEQRYLKWNQLPKMKVKYNWLMSPDTDYYEPNASNHNLGFSIAYPILTRAERNKVKINELNVRGYQVFKQQIVFELNQEVQMVKNELETRYVQVEQTKTMAEQYGKLYELEQILFDSGESSLFILNSREQKYLNTQIKQIQTQVKFKITEHKYDNKLAVY